MSEQFRRTDPRYDRRIDVEIIADGRSQVLATRNLSLGGLYVVAPAADALPVATRVTVRFSVPTQPEPIDVSGEVRWVEKNGDETGVGIRFHGLRARDVWALNRFFAS